MGMFRRRPPARTQDPDLPLSAFQARRLHQLVSDAFDERGVPVRSVGDRVVDDRGRGFHLRDLASECAVEPVGRWSELVRRHVQLAVAPGPTLEQLTEHTLDRSCVLRLVPAASLPPGWDPASPHLTPELTSVVAVDLGTEALTPPADALRRRAPHLPWRERAAENLRSRATDLPLHHETGPDFDVVLGESGLTASLALVLDDLLARLGRTDRGRGVLVGVPYRHQVVLRVVDGPVTGRTLARMADYLRSTHAVAPGPVSPLVHWVSDGTWRPVTRPGERLDPEVAEALGI